jgi:hypothetical protein
LWLLDMLWRYCQSCAGGVQGSRSWQMNWRSTNICEHQ